MPSLGGTTSVTCPPGRWTSLWDGPTFGFTYVWNFSGAPMRVDYRRWSTGIPWYLEATIFLNLGKNTVPHGGPSAYMKLEVRPPTTAVLRAT